MNIHQVERISIEQLHPHPKNYKSHPEDQLSHITKSLKDHGFYRNIVVARDYTILAGHGVVLAATQLGITEVPVIVLDIDPHDPRAIKVMISDNEISNLAEIDDRLLIEHLNTLMGADDLLGTGYDPQQLLARDMLTRPPELLQPKNEAAEWVDMPGFEHGTKCSRLIMLFRSDEDRDAFVQRAQVVIAKKSQTVWSAWWPPQEEDAGAVRWSGEATS